MDVNEVMDALPDVDDMYDDSALCNAFSSISIKDFGLANMIRAQQEEDRLLDQLERNDSLSSRYMNIIAKHCVSNEAASDIWNFIRAMNVNRKLKCYKTIYSRIKESLPDIEMTFELRNKLSQELDYHSGTVYPEKLFPKSKYETLSEWTHSTLDELWEFHKKIHPKNVPRNKKRKYDMSVDGVPLSRSGIDQMTLVCIRFLGCRTVYLAGVYVYRDGHKTDLNDFLLRYVVDARNEGFHLNVVIADSPARYHKTHIIYTLKQY